MYEKRPNGSGSIVKIKGRRKPYRAVVTSGYTVNGNGNKNRFEDCWGIFRIIMQLKKL